MLRKKAQSKHDEFTPVSILVFGFQSFSSCNTICIDHQNNKGIIFGPSCLSFMLVLVFIVFSRLAIKLCVSPRKIIVSPSYTVLFSTKVLYESPLSFSTKVL